ncbi:MAG: hypothetical protein LM582_07210 [Desulfurococcaceae archaeon]|nr:hypothetical protein [Desulfurococcaceae archaeon]
MLTDVVKALFYTCSSYPKIAAPHRLSPSDDFEICILSSVTNIIELYSDIYRVIAEFKRGERGIGKLEIGRFFAKSLNNCFKELKYGMSLEMCLVTPTLSYVDILETEIEKDFRKVLRRFINILQAQDIEESIEFTKVARNIGGRLATLLEKAGVSEHRIKVEGLTLYNIFDELSKYDPLFESFINVQKLIDVVRLAEKLYKEYGNINEVLSKVFLELVKDKITPHSGKLADLLKMDLDYRRRGVYLQYIMPYLSYASLYIVKHL